MVLRTHAQFGFAVLVDCHSMPASIRIGESGVRPDFIVGDRFGASTSAAVVEHAISLLSAMGYTVAHNKPYAGGFITEHYGRPARGTARAADRDQSRPLHERAHVPEIRWLRCAGQ